MGATCAVQESEKTAKLRKYLQPTLSAISLNEITKVDLVGNHLGDEGAILVAKELKPNYSVTYLDVRWNSITRIGGTAIADLLLASNCVLHTLDLFCNSLGNAGASQIATALKSNTSLRICRLGWNGIKDEGAIALADALKDNTALAEIGLERNSIANEGAAAISEMLKSNKSLGRVGLWHNAFSDEALEVFIASMDTGTCAANIELVNPGSDSGNTRRTTSFDSLQGT